MTLLLWASATLAALLHAFFFCLESLWWMRPAVHRRVFGVRAEEARVLRLMAFNQGFYNLFLGLGAAAGLVALALGHGAAGAALVGFSCAAMLGAALVLLGSKPAAWTGALVQGLPPAVALAALSIG